MAKGYRFSTGFSGHYKSLRDWGKKIRLLSERCEMNLTGIETYIDYRAESGKVVGGRDLDELYIAKDNLRDLKKQIDRILEKL